MPVISPTIATTKKLVAMKKSKISAMNFLIHRTFMAFTILGNTTPKTGE